MGYTRTRNCDKDEPVGRLATELLLVDIAAEQLDVAAAAVELLLVLDGELQHQGLVLVAELRVLRRDGVEPVVLRGLDACARLQKQGTHQYRPDRTEHSKFGNTEKNRNVMIDYLCLAHLRSSCRRCGSTRRPCRPPSSTRILPSDLPTHLLVTHNSRGSEFRQN
jgi:hypothetical protein